MLLQFTAHSITIYRTLSANILPHPLLQFTAPVFITFYRIFITIYRSITSYRVFITIYRSYYILPRLLHLTS